MGEAAGPSRRWSAKPFALWVIFGCLVYFGLAVAALLVPILVSVPGAASDPLTLSSLVFIGLSLFGGYAAVRGTRWGLVLAIVLSIVFLGFFGSFLVPGLTNPADPNYWLTISVIPALVLAAAFSILSLFNFRKGISHVPYLASPKSAGNCVRRS